jgi:hypothetical protein
LVAVVLVVGVAEGDAIPAVADVHPATKTVASTRARVRRIVIRAKLALSDPRSEPPRVERG